jgi:site-specific DNA recombinase
MLSNKTYTGKVFLKAYNGEPEQWIDAVHTPLISEDVFNRVQQVKNKKSKPFKQSKDDIQHALPLRGHLVCPNCGHNLTGGISKGNGGKYPYYRCQPKKYNCREMFPAKKAHEALIQYLKAIEPNPEVLELFVAVLADVFNTNDGNRLNEKKAIESKIETINNRIEKISNDYADGLLNVQEYKQLKTKLDAQSNELVMQHTTFTKTPHDFDKYISYSTRLLQNISSYYNEVTPSIQNKLIGFIFPEKLIFNGIEYKTTKINEAMQLMCLIDKGLKENSPAKIARLYSQAPQSGLEPETL